MNNAAPRGSSLQDVLRQGNVAVVTGAANGIGLAMARRFQASGMHVCMLDADGDRLDTAAAELANGASGGEILSLRTDVSQLADLEGAQRAVEERWGRAPALLVNNAATRVGGGVFSPLEDWRLTFDVNLWGIVNGVHVFAPAMMDTDEPGMIINVGSKQGITNPPGNTAYNMTKAAVRTYTEGLEHTLRNTPNCNVSAHLLVPGWTTTGDREHKQGAWLPDQVVDYMCEALQRGAFYIICPDDDVSEEMDRMRIQWAALDITEDRPPLSRWVSEYKQAFEEFSNPSGSDER